MRACVIGSFVLVGALMLAQPVFAMGGDYQINPDGNIVTEQPDWPAGLADLINSGPVFSGHWVNANSEFFFLGDAASLTRFLSRYSTLKNTPLLVVIHAGSERRSELWGENKPATQYDWKVLLQKRGWGVPTIPEKPEEQWVVTVDVWIDRNVRLSELRCPTNVEVKSGGEIERFILHAAGKDLGSAGWNTYANYDKAVRAGQEKRIGEEVEIPAKYWSDPIKALNPVKVYLHRLNVVVVQRVENGAEEGKYLGNLISSYAPQTGDDGFIFTPDPVTGVRDFKRTIEPSAAMEAAIGPTDLWIPVLAESPEYQKLAGPELVLIGRIATGGGYPAGHPEQQVWSHHIDMHAPWLPVADLRDCQGPFDKLRGKRTPLEFNRTMVLIKATLKHDRSQGKYPVVVPGWMREIRPDEAEWKLPWPANLPLLPPEGEIFSIPLIITCEATSVADSRIAPSGVQNVGQQFKVLEVFHGDATPGQSMEIRYNYLYINGVGRDVAQGERVIWVMTGNRDQVVGYAAVPDTPYHRKEAQGLAARVKAALLQDRFDLSDLGLSKAETATTHEAELPDLFAESAPGSKSWQLRKEVSVVYSGPDGAVYFVPEKKFYYVRREVYSPTGARTQPWYFGPFQNDPSLLPAKPAASGAAKETH